MNNQGKILFITILCVLFQSCAAQKMMRTIGQASQLVINKKDFIDKPLSKLISQIKPEIKGIAGSIENANPYRSTVITLYFLTKEELMKRNNEGKTPIRVLVYLANPNLGKTYPPLKDNNKWTDGDTKLYGDLIVKRIFVLGDDGEP